VPFQSKEAETAAKKSGFIASEGKRRAGRGAQA
jgi:hypothetical protein